MSSSNVETILNDWEADYLTLKKQLEEGIQQLEKMKYKISLEQKVLGLSGHGAEIVRCLRDALHNPDPEYKDICLWIILGQFAVIEKELDLLKDWPHRKELLHKMDEDYGVDIRKGICREE